MCILVLYAGSKDRPYSALTFSEYLWVNSIFLCVLIANCITLYAAVRAGYKPMLLLDEMWHKKMGKAKDSFVLLAIFAYFFCILLYPFSLLLSLIPVNYREEEEG